MTTEEIYNQIITEKESGNYPELDELNSTSKTAIWRLWVWIFATFSNTIRVLFDELKLWVEDYFARKQVGTLQWWIDQIKDWQYGDELIFVDGKFQYESINEEKQIVKQVAIDYLSRVLIVKTAKEVNEVLSPLTTDEKTSLESYIAKIKLPGTYVSVVSSDATKLNINYRIYYNAEITQASIEQDTTDAIADYLNNLVFNGKFVPTNLTDKIQTIQGVINPIFVSAEAQEYGSADWNSIADQYKSLVGYMALNTLTIEFIENV